MKIKNKKVTLGLVATVATIALISSCKAVHPKAGPKKDCSALFETRYAGKDGASKRSSKSLKNDMMMTYEGTAEDVATECKVLEFKLDNNTKCELVGSDRIDNFSKILEKNDDGRIILVTPEKKVRNISDMANKYLESNGISINKYFDSDVFKNLNFPYKGMRCEIAKKEFVVWSGNKQVIVTIKN